MAHQGALGEAMAHQGALGEAMAHQGALGEAIAHQDVAEIKGTLEDVLTKAVVVTN